MAIRGRRLDTHFWRATALCFGILCAVAVADVSRGAASGDCGDGESSAVQHLLTADDELAVSHAAPAAVLGEEPQSATSVEWEDDSERIAASDSEWAIHIARRYQVDTGRHHLDRHSIDPFLARGPPRV